MAPGAAGIAALLIVACGASAAPAVGAPDATRDRISARLTVDNDHFNFWQAPRTRPDFGYTHGTELALSLPRAPRGLARLAPAWLLGTAAHGGEAALELRLSQRIYSPWALPPDRPYAGWLGASIGLSRGTPQAHREVLLHLGVTGPPSLAGELQRFMHTRFSVGSAPDWTDQLPFEPGLGIEASAARILGSSRELRGAGIALGISGRGRLATHAVDLRLALPFVAGWSPPGLWPAGAGARRGPSLHVRLEPHVDLIARDEFLDGPLFRDGPGPGARGMVAESEAALGLGWGPATFEWTIRRRSREYDSQPRPHTYSALGLSWNP